jgi:hypothetical protein
MRVLKQSAAANVMVFMTQAADHVTGLAGLTLTITASKDGGAFAGIAPTVTDRGSGWYNLALDAAMTDTLGDLALHITGGAADPSDLYARVVARPFDDLAFPTVSGRSLNVSATGEADANVALWLNSAPNALIAGRVDVSVGANQADVITAAALAADAGTEIAAAVWAAAARTLTALDEDNTTLDLDATIRAAVGLTVANLDTQLDALPTAAEIRAEMDSNSVDLNSILLYVDELETRLSAVRAGLLDNLDATISSRLSSAGYTAPDNAGIAAVQAKTDQMTFTVANKLDVNVLVVNGVTVTGDGSLGTPWGPA